MKTNFKTLLAAFACATVLFSCVGSKEVTTETPGAVEITLPFSEAEYQSDKEAFRAKNNGKSMDLATSKKIAMMNAKSELAGLINTKVKTVNDQYTNQRQVGENTDFESKFESMTRSVVNQQLSEIKVIGEKTFKNKDGKYETWVALEMKKDALINNINQSISKKKKLQLDFDKHKYEEIFNKEMEKFESEN